MNAQESFEYYINSLLKDVQNLREHTERVVALCEEFAEMYPDAVDRDLLLDAAWLHDIAKYRVDNKHNNPQKVLAQLEKYALGDDIVDIGTVANIIEMHKGTFKPQEKKLESAVLRLCDKLDRLEKGKDDAEEKCEATLDKAKEKLKKSKYKKLKQFYKSKLQMEKAQRSSRKYKLIPIYSSLYN